MMCEVMRTPQLDVDSGSIGVAESDDHHSQQLRHESPTSMRVLLLSSSSGSFGGGELYLLTLAQGLSAMGVCVEVMLSDETHMDALAIRMKAVAQVSRFRYVNTYRRRFRSIGSLWSGSDAARVVSQLVARRPDVIHLNKQNVEDGLDLIAALGSVDVPSVCTIHNTRSMTSLGARMSRFRDWVARRALRAARAPFIAVAQQCRRDLLAFLNDGVEEAVTCISNGVSEAEVVDRKAIRAQWGCTENDIVIGCLARLEPEKNPLFLVDCLKGLPGHVHLVWVGEGRSREARSIRAAERGVSHRLHLDGWRDDGRNRLAGFDVFTLASSYEGFPLAVLEAMSASLPCVASDVDGTREAVVHGVNGFLCPVLDLHAWIDRIRQLVESPSLRAQMGQAGKNRWREQFSLEAMAGNTLDFYRKVIGKFKTSGTACV